MPVESGALFDARETLPVEIRASLDLLFELIADERGVLRSAVTGEPALIDALARYGTVESDHVRTTFLGASGSVIRRTIERNQPARATILGSGALQQAIRPLRRSDTYLPIAPPRIWWERQGYQLVRMIAIQGVGSIFWSVGDRLLRRANKPHLADRCRVAMLRTLVGAHRRLVPSALVIQEFQRSP